MAFTVRCSACGKPVQQGAERCGGCGLPLSAQAVAVPDAEKAPLLTLPRLLFLCLLVLIFVIYAVSLSDRGKAEAGAAATFAADLRANRVTPEEFIAHCGAPVRQEDQHGQPTLDYMLDGATDLHVVFAADGARTYRIQQAVADRSGRYREKQGLMSEKAALARLPLGCGR